MQQAAPSSLTRNSSKFDEILDKFSNELCRKLPHALNKPTISPTATPVKGHKKKICLGFKTRTTTTTKTIPTYTLFIRYDEASIGVLQYDHRTDEKTCGKLIAT